jgi:hypothetical protein
MRLTEDKIQREGLAPCHFSVQSVQIMDHSKLRIDLNYGLIALGMS